MKRVLSVLGVVVLLTGGLFAYRTVSECARWQDTYKKFLYTEMIQNGPIVMQPAIVDEIIGEAPYGCDRPETLSDGDIARYESEGIDYNYFNDLWRAAFKRTDGFENI